MKLNSAALKTSKSSPNMRTALPTFQKAKHKLPLSLSMVDLVSREKRSMPQQKADSTHMRFHCDSSNTTKGQLPYEVNRHLFWTGGPTTSNFFCNFSNNGTSSAHNFSLHVFSRRATHKTPSRFHVQDSSRRREAVV